MVLSLSSESHQYVLMAVTSKTCDVSRISEGVYLVLGDACKMMGSACTYTGILSPGRKSR